MSSRSDRDRLVDVLQADAAIAEHLQHGPLSDGLSSRPFVCASSRSARPSRTSHPSCSTTASIPCRQVAARRDQLAHRYFHTSHAAVAQTVGADLVKLPTAAESLLAVLDEQR